MKPNNEVRSTPARQKGRMKRLLSAVIAVMLTVSSGRTI